jgi:hypothetical protein
MGSNPVRVIMTLPHEEYNSLVNAKQFLFDLLDPKLTPGVPKAIRERARAVLKHYPFDMTLKEFYKESMHHPDRGIYGWGKGKDE